MSELSKPERYSVGLSFNVTYGGDIARELARAGVLGHYYGNVFLHSPVALRSRSPVSKIVHRLNATRVFDGLDDQSISRLLAPECAYVALGRTRLAASRARRVQVSEVLFDLSVAARLGKFSIVHFASGAGLHTARRAKQLGAFVVCHRRALHHEVENRMVHAAPGVDDWSDPERLISDRLAAEYDVADRVLVNSSLAKQSFITQGFPESKIRVIHYGVNLLKFAPPRIPVTGAPTILYVGQIDPRKGIETLGEATADLPEDIRVTVIGTGADAYVDKLRRRFPHLCFLGRLPRDQLVEHYQKAALLVLPSFVDSFGFVVVEALACGTPVAVTTTCGSAEIVVDGTNGFTFEAGDTSALLRIIEAALDDFGGQRDLSTAARGCREGLGWPSYAQHLDQLYRELLEG